MTAEEKRLLKMRRHSSKLLKLHLNEKTRMDGKYCQVKGKAPRGQPKELGKRLPKAIKKSHKSLQAPGKQEAWQSLQGQKVKAA